MARSIVSRFNKALKRLKKKPPLVKRVLEVGLNNPEAFVSIGAAAGLAIGITRQLLRRRLRVSAIRRIDFLRNPKNRGIKPPKDTFLDTFIAGKTAKGIVKAQGVRGAVRLGGSTARVLKKRASSFLSRR